MPLITTMPKFMRVATCFIWNKGKVLFVQRASDKTWAIPGGKMEAGETPTDTIIREFREEVRLDLANPEILKSVPLFYLRNDKELYVDYIMSQLTLDTLPKITLNQESLDYVWMTLSQAITLDLNGQVTLDDGRTIYGKLIPDESLCCHIAYPEEVPLAMITPLLSSPELEILKALEGTNIKSFKGSKLKA